MATPNTYPGGFGGTSGSALATATTMISSGYAYYVDSVNGDDSATNNGLNREQPLQTLAQAITNSSAGDTIVLLGGSSFTLTAVIALAGRHLIGEGTGSNIPTIVRNMTGSPVTTATSASVISNIKFAAGNSASNTTNGTLSIGVKTFLDNVTLVGGNTDDAPLLVTTADVTAENLTFTSAATSKAGAPLRAFSCATAGVIAEFDSLTIDGGTYGWSGSSAFSMTDGANLFARGVSLQNGSDMVIAVGVKGYIALTSGDKSSRIEWG